MNITIAMPETMADIRNTMGIRTLPHPRVRLHRTENEPDVAVSRKADGMPMMVTNLLAFLSKASASG